VSGGRACGVAEPVSLDRHRLGGSTPRQRRRRASPVIAGASPQRASTRYSDPSPDDFPTRRTLERRFFFFFFSRKEKKNNRVASRSANRERVESLVEQFSDRERIHESTRTSSAGGMTRTARRRAARPA